MIRIKAPLHAVEDCLTLIEAGAAELYCGVAGGGANYRSSDPNSQLPGLDALKEVISISSSRGTDVYLCLNSFGGRETRRHQLDQARAALGYGVFGIIVSDISLIREIRALGRPVKIVLGTLAGCLNSRSLRFFAGLGADRVVLERQLGLEDIASIAACARDAGIGVEVIIQNLGCENVNAFCRLHSFVALSRVVSSGRRLNPCWRRHEVTYFGGETAAPEVVNAGSEDRPARLLRCGLCSLYQLRKSGVEAAKIVGRHLPARKTARDVALLRDYLAACASGRVNDGNFVAVGQELRRAAWGRPCGPGKCFYQEIEALRRGPGWQT
ncbi:MAG: U32 family peptidase [Elusimicrobiales bacterium]|nr:U32 family peptidase [Elusimicrobiales bacterium]